MTFVTTEFDQHIATMTMNDPARRNALGLEMLTGLCDAFDQLAQGTRVVILRAADDAKVWCAGFDITALSAEHDPLAPDGPLHALFGRIAACPAPVIGMLHGSAWGGGADLALRCDLLSADDTATIAFTPARLGLPYDEPGLRNAAARLGPALAMEMFATAEPISAERADRAGILARLVSPDRLETETMALARRIAANAPLTVASAKLHLRAIVAEQTLEDAGALRDSRHAALASADFREGLDAFRGKRPPVFTGQ